MNSLFFIFNFFINAIFVFFTTILFVDFFLFALRIKNYRAKYFARLIPLFKLFFDITIYNFSSWGILYGLSPVSCEKGSRVLNLSAGWSSSLQYILPKIKMVFHFENGKTFSVADILAKSIGLNWTSAISIVFLLLAIFGLLRLIFRYRKNIFFIKNIKKNMKPFSKGLKIDNKLKKLLFKNKITLKTSEKIFSPCFIKHKEKMILFPKKCLDIFTKKECEAVIYHELEHIFWKDRFFNFLISVTNSIFYYIPFFRSWIKKLILEREYACDQNAKVDCLNLATALKKCAVLNLKEQFAMSFVGKETLKKRINILFSSKKRKKIPKILSIFQYAILSVMLIAIFFGKFWIF